MSQYQIRQLIDEVQPPESGKQSIVLTDDDDARVVLVVFAAGDGLKQHVAPLPAIIQIIKGEAIGHAAEVDITRCHTRNLVCLKRLASYADDRSNGERNGRRFGAR